VKETERRSTFFREKDRYLYETRKGEATFLLIHLHLCITVVCRIDHGPDLCSSTYLQYIDQMTILQRILTRLLNKKSCSSSALFRTWRSMTTTRSQCSLAFVLTETEDDLAIAIELDGCRMTELGEIRSTLYGVATCTLLILSRGCSPVGVVGSY
jgi:hypothetical protein